MAGIGFELRKYLNDDTFTGSLKAYGYAGLISAGPWILSILGVLLIGIISVTQEVSSQEVKYFTSSVTWLMGVSLILTGLLQLVFTRFVSDRLFEGKDTIINANLLAALLLTTVVSGVLGVLFVTITLSDYFAYAVLMVANFVTLSNVWILVIFVAGLRRFKLIVAAFAIGYTTTVILAILLTPYGLNGMLGGLLIGHLLLMYMLLVLILREYHLVELVRWDFLQRRQIYPALIAIGFFYNAGIWVDKFIFWYHPVTSEHLIGPLRFSVIYDLPIFLAYLSIIPGMAVFLLRIETDFAEAYEAFFNAVRADATLQEIEALGNDMINAVREGIFQILKVQSITILVLVLLGPKIIEWLGISPKYIHIYYIDLVGVGVQVLMLAVLNVLFYLDRLWDALKLTATLFISNALFTAVTLYLGAEYYGYGFGVSMTLTTLYGFHLLAEELEHIEYHTFMRPRREATSGNLE